MAALLAVLASCAGTSTLPPAGTEPAALRLLLASTAQYPALGVDTIEVWVCDVPLASTDPTYDASSLRLPLSPRGLSESLNRYVTPYFAELSHGLYQPRFVRGKTFQMTDRDSPHACVDDALRHAATTSNAILAVATAEHRSDAPGGFAVVGSPCLAATRSQCPAISTGRSAYVGASDFHPDWGPEPAVDLEEHEIGHLLGWPHSGDDQGEGHSSGLDVMSESAAPRGFDSAHRNAPDTLGINRLAARWLSLSDVAVATVPNPAAKAEAATFELSPSTAASGRRLLILPVDEQRMLTVDFLPKSGLDDFLPAAGVTITLIDLSPAACGHTDGTPCAGESRVQHTEVGHPPYFDMLATPGASWSADGWTVTIVALGQTATVQVARQVTAG